MQRFWRLIALLGLLGGSGCIVGTWPTPEERSSTPQKPAALRDEACDGQDDDGDGAIDEGCPCAGGARGCVGVAQDLCGIGVQYCDEGHWTDCLDIGPPHRVLREPSLALSIQSTQLARDALALEVVATPTTHCDLIVLPFVALTLASESPEMTVRGRAKDDGVAPDTTAQDGIYTVALPNAFGPGVGGQMLSLTGTATIKGAPITAAWQLPLLELEVVP